MPLDVFNMRVSHDTVAKDSVARRSDDNLDRDAVSTPDHGLTGASIIGAATEKLIDRLACRAQIRKGSFIVNMLCR